MSALNDLIVDENSMAFHPMMGNSYQLNEISKDIISLLKQNRSKAEIIEALSEDYEVSKEELFIDVSDFLSKLKVYGLL
jgi:hypothetical protein